jgi:hypothetical protein
MLELGAEQVLIDGAVDRRAASSPSVADGLVMATGAILASHIERVVQVTADAVELVRLPLASGTRDGVALARRTVLCGEPADVAALLAEHPGADTFVIDGALSESFLEALLAARAGRAGRELRIVAEDPTRVFLSRRGAGWYRRQGISIEVLRPIELKAITVNPVAPQSHSFDSATLRAALGAAVGDVPVLDVRESG